jgi:hypothetical protein
MYIPGIQSLVKGIINIDIIGLSISDWGICLVGAVIPVLVIEIAKWINRSRGEYF